MTFISKKHILPVLAISVPVLVVYLLTMPPGLTWEHYGYDAGDLIACIYTFGIPHPPGTPLYVLLGQIFRFLPFFGAPAAKFNFMSMVFGWLSLLVTYFTSFKLTANRFASLVATFFLAFAPLFWGQSIIAEVLTLNLFLVALLIYFLVSWEHSDVLGHRQDKFLYLSLFSFGLALSNHTSSLMVAPAILFIVLSVAPDLLRSVPRLFKMALAFLLGLLPYLYLPIRASMRPPLNWGDPSNLSRFISHVTAREYQGFLFVSPVLVLDYAARFLDSVWRDFNPFGVLLLALGLFFGRRGRVRDFLVFTLLFQLLFTFNYNIVNIETYLLPAFLILALLLAEGCVVATDLFSKAAEWVKKKDLRLLARVKPFWRRKEVKVTFAEASLLLFNLLLVTASGANVYLKWEEVDLHDERKAYDYGREVFNVLEPGAIVLTEGDNFFLGLTYFKHVVFPERADVAVFHEAFFYQLSWMLKQAIRNHPELEFPRTETTMVEEEAEEALLKFVEANRRQHPIYLAVGEEPLEIAWITRTFWGDEYVIQSVGPIYKIIGRKKEDS